MWTSSVQDPTLARSPATSATRLEVVVSFDGAVLAVHHLAPGRSLVFGPPSERPDYPVQQLAAPLAVASHGATPCCEFPEGATGSVTSEGSTTTLAALVEARLCQPIPAGHRYALPAGAALSVTIGALAVRVQQVAALPQRLPRAPLDLRAGRFVVGSLLLHGALVALALLVPPDPRALAGQDLSRLDNRALARIIPPVPPPPPITEVASAARESAGARAVGPARSAPRTVVAHSNAVRPSGSPTPIDRQALRELTRGAGLLSVLGTLRAGSAAAGLFSGERALDPDAEQTLQGLTGEAPADPYSVGPGIVQAGSGGNDATVLATLPGHCRGPQCGSGPGSYPSGKLPPMAARRPVTITSPMPTEVGVIGKIPAEIIRRVVRSRMNEFRFCYERTLAHTVASPRGSDGSDSLRGRVVVSFLIGGDGRVLSAVTKESSLAGGPPAREVQDCVTAAVRRLSFPQPEGAGLVQVQYPFLFQPAGG